MRGPYLKQFKSTRPDATLDPHMEGSDPNPLERSEISNPQVLRDQALFAALGYGIFVYVGGGFNMFLRVNVGKYAIHGLFGYRVPAHA